MVMIMEVNYSEIRDIVGKIPIFGAMNESEIESLIFYFKKKSVKKGEIVIKEGDSPENIYIILKGEIAIIKNDIEITKLKIGDCFGEIEIIGIIPSIAFCEASEDADLIFLPKKALRNIKKENTELFIKLILNIARECCRRLASNNNFFVKALEEYSEDKNEDYY